MNNGNILSLGNIINSIKKISNNSNAMQTEIFCSIFGVNEINTTTVNNYCIGIRAIGIEYKRIFEEKYNDNSIIKNILSLVNILENKVYSEDNALDTINKSDKLKKVIEELKQIATSDEHIDDINKLLKDNNYETIKEMLYYAIIINKQPVYSQNINIKINKQELNEYMRLELYWGESYISSLLELAKKNNMYACAKLGSLEFEGAVTGTPNYKKSFQYYLKSANKNHPKSCWMIANLILTNKVEYDFDTMWKYLNKSIELGSAAGYNTMGLCYLRGINKENKIDKEKAEYYFKIAGELGYVFAFNNLGKIYEEKDEEEAMKYYNISADMNNSWALNKVGEYHRKNNDYIKAYIYYSKAVDCPITEICRYAFYNLAKYYYEPGFKELNIKADKEKAKYYYDMFNKM